MIKTVEMFLRMIRFSHSIFALPFAFAAALIAAGGMPGLREIFWIVVAMVGARSGAMGLNRVIDREIDAMNPRTMSREVPAGKIAVTEALVFSVFSLGLMVLAAYMLNPLCFKLSPVAIAVLVLYSYCKRFTWAAHFVLGLAISAGPIGAWIAVRGTFDIEVLPLGMGVLLWLAGFDILYALQDTKFDRDHRLHSIPARFGIKKSIALARALHLGAWCMLVINGMVFSMGAYYWAGMALIGGLFVYEHSLVKHDDLGRLDVAFFNMNGYISVSVFVFTFIDVLAR